MIAGPHVESYGQLLHETAHALQRQGRPESAFELTELGKQLQDLMPNENGRRDLLQALTRIASDTAADSTRGAHETSINPGSSILGRHRSPLFGPELGRMGPLALAHSSLGSSLLSQVRERARNCRKPQSHASTSHVLPRHGPVSLPLLSYFSLRRALHFSPPLSSSFLSSHAEPSGAAAPQQRARAVIVKELQFPRHVQVEPCGHRTRRGRKRGASIPPAQVTHTWPLDAPPRRSAALDRDGEARQRQRDGGIRRTGLAAITPCTSTTPSSRRLHAAPLHDLTRTLTRRPTHAPPPSGHHGIDTRSAARQAQERALSSTALAETEPRVVRDVILCSQGVDGTLLRLDTRGAFGPSQSYHLVGVNAPGVPRPAEDLAKRMAELGWLYRRVAGFAEAESACGATQAALRAALRTELASHYRMLAVLQEHVAADDEASGGMTLVSVKRGPGDEASVQRGLGDVLVRDGAQWTEDSGLPPTSCVSWKKEETECCDIHEILMRKAH